MKSTQQGQRALIAILVICTTLALAIFFFVSLQPYLFERAMSEPSRLLNLDKMTMVDSETRFDSGVIRPNKSFEFNYTLINHDPSSIEVKALRNDVHAVLLKRVQTSPKFMILRDHKAIIMYHYRDKNGRTLFRFSFKPNEYLNVSAK